MLYVHADAHWCVGKEFDSVSLAGTEGSEVKWVLLVW